MNHVFIRLYVVMIVVNNIYSLQFAMKKHNSLIQTSKIHDNMIEREKDNANAI